LIIAQPSTHDRSSITAPDRDNFFRSGYCVVEHAIASQTAAALLRRVRSAERQIQRTGAADRLPGVVEDHGQLIVQSRPNLDSRSAYVDAICGLAADLTGTPDLRPHDRIEVCLNRGDSGSKATWLTDRGVPGHAPTAVTAVLALQRNDSLRIRSEEAAAEPRMSPSGFFKRQGGDERVSHPTKGPEPDPVALARGAVALIRQGTMYSLDRPIPVRDGVTIMMRFLEG
jgi:hypothetical protein